MRWEARNIPTHIYSIDLCQRRKSNSVGKRQSFQQTVLEQLDIHITTTTNLDTDLPSFPKFNSECVSKAIKLSEDKLWNLGIFELGDDFLDT